ncbi:bifunctional metallophosphatase/5'-nucleotidase [Rhizohabitans arisaemae]|uniref:bifunctional metallophosphatase/5'-nucleotidase n=1 Tax=Rhizohabitans arisaemae TaxID=2720610 RepID=UPI0024B0F270|nr:bifunctional metallophosphatase/5'-nucleotidase [Rhizohabitans arisaemae]
MTSRSLTRVVLATALAASGLALATVPATAAGPDAATSGHSTPQTVPVRLLALNDFHGNLEPPTGSSGRIVNEAGATVEAGGAAYIAAHLKALRDENTLTVAQGDMIGGTPLISAAYHDEPSVEFLDKIGVTASAVGNHEFDEGYRELLRIMKGGCHPVDGCSPAGPWKGAGFDYVGANVLLKKYNLPAIPPFTVRKVNGVNVAFIGAVTKTTPTIVTSDGIKDIKFIDEVEAVNKASKVLRLLGVKAQVVLVHEGDQVHAGQSPDACSAQPSAGYRIATQSDAEIDLVLEGHSHQAYICTVKDPKGNDRIYSQGSSFGRVITQVDLLVDKRTRDVVRSSVRADNHVVTRTITPDAEISAFVQTWKDRVAPVANRPIGNITADIRRSQAPSGESALGNLIADAQLASTRTGGNAVIALMNPGGVRSDLNHAQSGSEGDGVVTYGEAFTVQPFNNLMGVVTMTGAQLDALLEQQFQPQPTGTILERILSPSSSLRYTINRSQPVGSRVSDIKIDGVPVADTTSYRVAANNFLLGGGDAFSVFTQGTDLWNGPLDIDALAAYLTANSPISPPATDRITVAG